MARYFFNLYDDLEVLDNEGKDLPDPVAAIAFALQNIRAVAAEQVLNGQLDLSHKVEIADEAGAVVQTVSFADAISVLT